MSDDNKFDGVLICLDFSPAPRAPRARQEKVDALKIAAEAGDVSAWKQLWAHQMWACNEACATYDEGLDGWAQNLRKWLKSHVPTEFRKDIHFICNDEEGRDVAVWFIDGNPEYSYYRKCNLTGEVHQISFRAGWEYCLTCGTWPSPSKSR